LERPVANRTYRLTEIVGTSTESMEDAVRNGVARASETLRHLDWFEVTEVRGQIDGGEVRHWQVGVKIGFRLEDS
jgi:flavin-binding protein dodecin